MNLRALLAAQLRELDWRASMNDTLNFLSIVLLFLGELLFVVAYLGNDSGNKVIVLALSGIGLVLVAIYIQLFIGNFGKK